MRISIQYVNVFRKHVLEFIHKLINEESITRINKINVEKLGFKSECYVYLKK